MLSIEHPHIITIGMAPSNGQLLPEGTYYYVLRLDVSEESGIKGQITIFR